MLLTDYLTAPPDNDTTRYRVNITIEKIDNNPYYRDTGKTGINHFGLFVLTETQYDDSEWVEQDGGRIRFAYSGLKKPTLRQFTKHIKHQLECALFTLLRPKGAHEITSRDEITHEDIWVYTRLQGEFYENTTDFLKDYYYWYQCLYDTQKWYFDDRISILMDKFSNPIVNFADYPKDKINKFRAEIGENPIK